MAEKPQNLPGSGNVNLRNKNVTHTKRRNCCYILWPIYGSNAATNSNIVSASIILFYALVVHRHEINCTGEKLVPTIYLGEGIHEIDGKAR